MPKKFEGMNHYYVLIKHIVNLTENILVEEITVAIKIPIKSLKMNLDKNTNIAINRISFDLSMNFFKKLTSYDFYQTRYFLIYFTIF
jgi:hypothetical protein